ncbi:MAG TPA: hypothetical protein VFQ44_10115 [Streptosporangiaceae bacterium]|nr:hypothetical protein [Streptosporangiaceae bacterium]
MLEELTEHSHEDHRGWAETVSWRAWVRFLAGRPDQAKDELTAVLDALPRSDLAAVAELRQRRLILALESGAQPAEDDEAGLRDHLAGTSGMPAAELSALLAAAACRRGAMHARHYAAAAAESYGKVADDDVVRHLEGCTG